MSQSLELIRVIASLAMQEATHNLNQYFSNSESLLNLIRKEFLKFTIVKLRPEKIPITSLAK